MLLFTYILRILLVNFCFHSVLRLEMKKFYGVPRINIFLHCDKKVYLSHFFFIFASDNNLEVISKMILMVESTLLMVQLYGRHQHGDCMPITAIFSKNIFVITQL